MSETAPNMDFDEMKRARDAALDDLGAAFNAFEKCLRDRGVRVSASVKVDEGMTLCYGKIVANGYDDKWCLYVKIGHKATIKPLVELTWEARVAAAALLPKLVPVIQQRIAESATTITSIRDTTATVNDATRTLAAALGAPIPASNETAPNA